MGRFSLNYADVVEMETRHSSRLVELEAAGFIILLDLLHELSFRANWNNGGVELTDEQWDIAENWTATAATALMTIYECPDEEPPEEGEDVTFAILRDEKSSGTDGGSCAASTWNARDVNTEDDPDEIVSISSNQFTPIADDFKYHVMASCKRCGETRLRLYNVTQASVVKNGLATGTPTDSANDSTLAFLEGRFTANGSDAYRIDHYTKLANGGDGLGNAVNDGANEAYLSIRLELAG